MVKKEEALKELDIAIKGQQQKYHEAYEKYLEYSSWNWVCDGFKEGLRQIVLKEQQIYYALLIAQNYIKGLKDV